MPSAALIGPRYLAICYRVEAVACLSIGSPSARRQTTLSPALLPCVCQPSRLDQPKRHHLARYEPAIQIVAYLLFARDWLQQGTNISRTQVSDLAAMSACKTHIRPVQLLHMCQVDSLGERSCNASESRPFAPLPKGGCCIRRADAGRGSMLEGGCWGIVKHEGLDHCVVKYTSVQ